MSQAVFAGFRSELGCWTGRAEWRLLLVALALSVGCSRPLDRPLEGARPGRAGEAAAGGLVAPPPTVSAPTPTATPPPPVAIVLPSPSASPGVAGRNPILSGLLPAPDSQVQPGAVDIGARISASSDLAEVVLLVNGAPVEPRITAQNPRTWLVDHTSRLEIGKHEVRLNAKDRDGRAGGYRWQFEVQPRLQAPAAAPAVASPIASPPPRLPTPRRP